MASVNEIICLKTNVMWWLARLGEYTVHLCLIIKLVGWNISFYVDTCRYIFKSDGRSELPRNIWSVRLPCQFLGVSGWRICWRFTWCCPHCNKSSPSATTIWSESDSECVGVTDDAPWLGNRSTVFWEVVQLHKVISTICFLLNIKMKESEVDSLSLIYIKGPCLTKYKHLDLIIIRSLLIHFLPHQHC